MKISSKRLTKDKKIYTFRLISFSSFFFLQEITHEVDNRTKSILQLYSRMSAFFYVLLFLMFTLIIL